jgi:CubicO group peptidase (beta-lactamase class C family)
MCFVFRRPILTAVRLLSLLLAAPLATAAADQAPTLNDIAGLWEASACFGPDLRGPVVVDRTNGDWRADLRGRLVDGRTAGSRVRFDFGAGRTLTLDPNAKGGPGAFWRQGSGPFGGYSFITPVDLIGDGKDRWRGEVRPLDDRNTLYMPVRIEPDGTARVFIRNPERNAGRFLRIDHLELVNGEVRLMGKPFGARDEQVVGQPGQPSGFYPRGLPTVPYRYGPPPARSDGWPVGTLAEAGISQPDIERFIQAVIDLPVDGISTSDVHAVLIARHGKLVLEEYFHGFDRDTLHDTRSAAKSLTSTLAGAVIQAGYPLTSQTPVYKTMDASARDPRAAAMTVEHLLMQTSGLHCDDNDPDAPGNEDAMQQQRKQPDWYRFALDLPLISAPGTAAPVYCSTQANLVGGVIARASARPLEDLFRDLIASPLGITRYALNTQPEGQPYMGGGAYLLPRDFMKVGQLMLSGGSWQGRRLVSREWAARSTSPLEPFGDRQYGYLWWSQQYPYKGGRVRAYYAGGNGGQIVMVVPDLELVIGFWGGNYSDPALFIPQRKYVPEFVLPAVER